STARAAETGCWVPPSQELRWYISSGSRFAQWMQIAHQALQPLLQHMRVDLRGRDVGVAEQRLHRAQVGAVLQQMACEGVAQDVGADLLRLETRLGGERFEVACEMLARQVTALAE